MGLTHSLGSELTWGKGWGWGAVEEWGPDLFPLNKPEASEQWPAQPGSGEFWQEEAGSALGADLASGPPCEHWTQMWTQTGQVRLFQYFFFFCKTHLLHTRKQKMHFKKPTKLILSVLNAQPAHLIYFFTFWQSNWHRIWNHLKWIRSSLPRKYIYVPRDAVPTKYLVMSFLIICPKEDGEGLSAYLHGDNIQIWTTPASKRAISPLANTKQSAGDMVIFQKHSTLPNIWDSFAYTYTASRPKISGQF